MSIAPVQATNFASGTSSFAGQTFASPTAAGNFLVAVVAGTGSAAVTPPSGWSVAVTDTGLPVSATILYRENAPSISSLTVPLGSSATWMLSLAEYSDVALASSIDQTGSDSAGGTSGGVTTTNPDELIIALLTKNAGQLFSSPTGGFTNEKHIDLIGTASAVWLDQIVGSTGTYSTSFGGGSPDGGVIASFVQAGPPPSALMASAASTASATASAALTLGLSASAPSTAASGASAGLAMATSGSAHAVASSGAALDAGPLSGTAPAHAAAGASLGMMAGLSAAAPAASSSTAVLDLRPGLSASASATSAASAAVVADWGASAAAGSTAGATLELSASMTAIAPATATASASLSLAMGLSVEAASAAATATAVEVLPGVVDLIATVDREELLLTWDSDGDWFQVYIDGKLTWQGPATSVRLPLPATAVAIDVISIGVGDVGVDFSATLSVPAGGGNLAELKWFGGTYQATDIAAFHVYSGDSPGGAVDHAKILATIPAYVGAILDGFGLGGFGQGGFGRSASNYIWTSGPLAPGTWNFGVKAFDSAGNEGPERTEAVVIAGPPNPPAPFPDHTRLRYTYDQPSKEITLIWNPSP